MFNFTRQPSKGKRPHLKVVCLPGSSVMIWCSVAEKLLQKKKVSGSLEWPHLKEYASLGSLGRPEPREFSKKVQNGKASCCTLLKRITKLKCVNSEVRSVDINPTKEVASLGPMAPCRSHHRNHTR